MKRSRQWTSIVGLAASLAFAAGIARAQGPAAPAAGGGLRTMVTLDVATREVFLLGRSGGDILYRTPTSPPGVSATMKPDAVQRAEFDITVDDNAVFAFARKRQWLQAAQKILSVVQPTLPFLDLPDNNATDWAIKAGVYLRKAAQTAAQGSPAERETAPRLFASAYAVLNAAGRAEWHFYGESARMRAILCLIDLGRLDEAEKELARVREPDKGDATYGVYHLARGELLFARKKYVEAMDAAIQSLIYETKDIESFPDALILSARCYEELNEMHRTRDIYYEVARLFRGTDWGDRSRARLRRIMRDDLAAEAEETDIAAVFFGSAEDMKEVIEKFLAGSEGVKDIDVDAPATEPGAESKPEGEKP